MTKALKTVVREGLTVIALATYMLYLNWRLCLVFIAVIPIIAAVVTFVGRHFRRYSRRIQSSMGDVTQVSGEGISGYREIRIFGAQPAQRERFGAASRYNRAQNLKLAFVDGLSTPVIQTLLALALATLVWFALSPDILRGFTAGSLVAFLTAATQLGKPIRQLSEVQSVIQQGLAAAEDISPSSTWTTRWMQAAMRWPEPGAISACVACHLPIPAAIAWCCRTYPWKSRQARPSPWWAARAAAKPPWCNYWPVLPAATW